MKNESLVTLSDPQSQAAEAYRTLRVSLKYASLDDPLRSLVIAAPALEKGSDPAVEVAANLAVIMAQAGEQVILVDADLRRPRLHELFDVPNEDGLPRAILALDGGQPLPLKDTEIDGLQILTSGNPIPNPADILSSDKMSLLLVALEKRAEMVITVAPPVTVAVDAAVLGVKANGFLLAVRSGRTRRDRIEEAKELLTRFEVNLLGAVLTDVPGGSKILGY
ncbi:MAG: CpsD/CapB family tyrosine-protein kinase [Anaerolineae bacterium]